MKDNSGSYKNIIVERVDSMETTLAHIIPEFTANILLLVVMFAKSKGGYELSIEKTKKLNDTAAEYINGIEVIKAFGKTVRCIKEEFV